MFEQWRAGVAQAFTRGVAQGMVRPDIDCQGEADFFVASLEGAFALAKSAADMTVLRGILDRLVAYLNRLRPDPAHDRAGGHNQITTTEGAAGNPLSVCTATPTGASPTATS